jgi:Uma2 family endonuclease
MEATIMAMTRTYTADEVFELNLDEPFELIDGELHILPGSGQRSSAIGSNLLIEIGIFLKRSPIGVVTGENGGYVIRHNPDLVLCPDVGFLFNANLNKGKVHERFVPFAPDFAAEVISPSDRRTAQEAKVRLYLAAGTTLVWLIDPNQRTVTVFRPDRQPIVLDHGAELNGEDIFPGFSIPVAQIFHLPGEA